MRTWGWLALLVIATTLSLFWSDVQAAKGNEKKGSQMGKQKGRNLKEVKQKGRDLRADDDEGSEEEGGKQKGGKQKGGKQKGGKQKVSGETGNCVMCTDALSELLFKIKPADLEDGCQDPRVQDIESYGDADYCSWMIHLKVDQDEFYKDQYLYRKPGWVAWKGYKLRENDPEPGSCLRINTGFLCTCSGDYCNKKLPPCSWLKKVAKPDDPEPEGCDDDGDGDGDGDNKKLCGEGIDHLSDISGIMKDIKDHLKVNVTIVEEDGDE